MTDIIAQNVDRAEIQKIHYPVMRAEVVSNLQPVDGGLYLDGTLGLGGHTEAILNAAECEVCALDRDSEALALAEIRLAPFGSRAHFFHLSFDDFALALQELGRSQINGALLDLGISSLQLDNGRRGFSFREDAPLDMRMDQNGGSVRAWDLVNRASYSELKDWIKVYGEDPQAGRIARSIIESRQKKSIDTTGRLSEIIWGAYPPAWRRTARNHPATRVFQALRMVVNDEPGHLRRFLDQIWNWIGPGGRLAIISFHSLEDRMVKQAMRKWSAPEKDELGRTYIKEDQGHILYKKPLIPQELEIMENPRSRSAKLRVIEKRGNDRDFA